MGSNKTSGQKRRLIAAAKQSRWAPFWLMPKKYGLSRARKLHPSQLTRIKRRWRTSPKIRA